MSNSEHPVAQRLSVPPRTTRPPRALTDEETAALLRIADCLIPESGPNPRASAARDYLSYLQLALAARTDVFENLVASARALGDVGTDDLWSALRQMWVDDRTAFDQLSAVLAGAYFMTPQVKELIGYPGQHRDAAGFEDFANELETGILDPVLERGHIYVSANGE